MFEVWGRDLMDLRRIQPGHCSMVLSSLKQRLVIFAVKSFVLTVAVSMEEVGLRVGAE